MAINSVRNIHGAVSMDDGVAGEPRFVVVTSSYPIRGDGSEAAGSFIADLVEELAKHVAVRVVAPGPENVTEQQMSRIEVLRYRAPRQPLSTLSPWRPTDLYWLVRVIHAGAAATSAAIAGDTTRVLALWGLPCGEWARRASRIAGVDYSVWLLGSDVWTLGRLPLLRGMLARVMRQARQVFADGHRLAHDAEQIGGVPVEFLPSTRNIGSAAPAVAANTRAPFKLLFLGRWHRNKGIDLLLDALALLSAEDWQLIKSVAIQGGGPLDVEVRNKVAALRADGRNVEAGGFLAKNEAEAAIAATDWVLIPSRIESVPVIFSDAMKLGRPIIVTPVGDLPLLVDQYRCGVVAPTIDGAGIVRALRVALREGSQTYLAGTATAAAQFDIDRIVQRLLRAGAA